ncbi:uncharacterized protein N7483_012606 [Penicillium malachiteum]|uniref:uncharacterized protein n=1 Tax=Penicillium malachiteum TaxID=1324776 RepID=UPI002548EA7C|nr:uncharacterized protein N7483_012606 [Penicillium malachiteum]KAJ5715425.1 hypothetical protein N7483_012606 [Penicillium malachiteum]
MVGAKHPRASSFRSTLSLVRMVSRGSFTLKQQPPSESKCLENNSLVYRVERRGFLELDILQASVLITHRPLLITERVTEVRDLRFGGAWCLVWAVHVLGFSSINKDQ